MARFEVHHVKIESTGYDGSPSVALYVTESPGNGPARYVFFENGPHGARVVTEIRNESDGRDLEIPMSYPPRLYAQTVIDQGEKMRETVQRHGNDSTPALEAARRFMDAVEEYLANARPSLLDGE